ncbi:WxL domain-containing protein [Enterococcus sp. AZ177]|uniref:WxL domain-containing protein n=1 Tax=unclassified Enterococcus TaxID=2608891 RepID=UPI003D2FCE5F
MMQIKKKTLTLLFFSFFLGTLTPSTVLAESVDGDVNVEFSGRKDVKSGVKDPENPDEAVDPGIANGTQGPLRIDFVPQLDFGKGKVVNKKVIFPVNAQQFKGSTTSRGQFIQVSDYRPNPTGWALQIRQEEQFKSAENNTLKGAILSFDNSWTNSKTNAAQAPDVSKEVIHLNNIGETYDLAKAEFGKGGGTWSIVFGASGENSSGQKATLAPKLDDQGKPVIDQKLKKNIYSNSAVKLAIPEAEEIKAGTYSTVLTWIISELP